MQLSLADATVSITSPGDAQGVSDDVISGCESVLGAGHCVATAAESSPSALTTYFAEVSWLDPDNLAVRIRLFRGVSASTELFERQVAFLARDTREQRQRAAGVIIAAGVVSNLQAAATHATPTVEGPHEESAKRETAQPPPLPQSQEPIPRMAVKLVPPEPVPIIAWGADGGPLLASGLNAKQPQVGLGLRGWIRKSRLPWRMIAAASFAEGPYEPRLTSWYFNLSIAACIEQLRWFSPRLGLELSHSDIVATASGSSRSEGAQLLRYGATVGSDFVLRLGTTTALLSSLEVAATLPAYDVWVAEEQVGGASLLGWRAFVGLRIGRN